MVSLPIMPIAMLAIIIFERSRGISIIPNKPIVKMIGKMLGIKAINPSLIERVKIKKKKRMEIKAVLKLLI